MDQIHEHPFKKLHLVFGVVNDKDMSTIMPYLPKDATYYFCKPNISRGLAETTLKAYGLEYNLLGDSYNSVSEAYQNALANANDDDFIFIGGSTFVVAEIV